ncbi:MAG: DUF3419 domain-containing protein [Elusimicrobia bacterium]|nr:DUF3419 domain-containing protein [Elusimicrobiota bacterium]
MPESPALAADWIETARRRPVAFAQVREDAALDLEVLAACPAGARIAMIASGGCTASALAADRRAGSLLLVDASTAQLAITRLKLDLLGAPPEHRASVLGHAPQDVAARAADMSERLARLALPLDALGPLEDVAAAGLDFCGRYEAVFARVQELIKEPGPYRLPEACADAFALPALTALFGADAVRRSARPFAEHFAARLAAAQARPGAGDNPYLSLMLHGRLPERRALPWMNARARAVPPAVEFFEGGMRQALSGRKAEFDFIHLSNILDWLEPGPGAELLATARHALKPGGFVLLRRLNSNVDPRGLDPVFDWLDGRSARLHDADRSAIYSAVSLGKAR